LSTCRPIDAIASENRAFWTAFLRSLVKRGLRGVRLVTSDAHEGLKQAIATVLGGATWQRCRVHFMRNLLATVPKGAREAIAAVVLPAQNAEKSCPTGPTGTLDNVRRDLRQDASAQADHGGRYDDHAHEH
jgi:transposase-like protein